MGDRVSVAIEGMTQQGEGIARVHGQVLFVSGALSGQTVLAVIRRRQKNYLSADVERVMHHSPWQILPPCPHVHTCGGCPWQALRYDRQLIEKTALVCETLQRTTPIDRARRQSLGTVVRPTLPSPEQFHYRNKLMLSFGRAVSKSGHRNIPLESLATIGFHRPGEWRTVVPIQTCLLYDEHLPQLLQRACEVVDASNLPVYDPVTGRGVWRGVMLRRGRNTAETMVAYCIAGPLSRVHPIKPLLERSVRDRPETTSLMLLEQQGREHPQIVATECLRGNGKICERLFDLTFRLSPASFFQVNTAATETLYTCIAKLLEPSKEDVVIDAYCGLASIGQFLARFAGQVIGIEADAVAVTDALQSIAENRLSDRVTVCCGRTEDCLGEVLAKHPSAIVVVDPPRAGLHLQALQAITTHRPQRLVYVSCHPATFARDLGVLLTAGYELSVVQPVNLFPQTAHVELVALLKYST